ncbi:MAG: TAXI family TRAP transporter solute-binding subunit [Acetobacteraceae bacterium]|nr:TAXI family TRAP transporter solute-binding subunit [Acetobacteraceae bacterium]
MHRVFKACARVVGAVLISASLIGPSLAQVASPRRAVPFIPDTQVVPPTAVLGIISGGLSGTYIRIATEIAGLFSAKVPKFRILPIVGKGSLQNISDILNIRDVDIAIVQSDVLSYLRQAPSTAGLTNNISYVAKLYEEEVHILARDEVATVADLNGKRVAIDALGSGTALTATTLFNTLGIKPILLNDDPVTALTALKRGDIDALVYVTGKPARLFSDAANSGLHLLGLPLTPALLQTYLPSRFDHADYPDLIAESGPVETVAVGAVLAVYNWAPGTERYTRLSRFVDGLFDNLADLQTPGHHPKWRQVNLAAQVPGWSRFRAAQVWLERHSPARSSADAATPEKR